MEELTAEQIQFLTYTVLGEARGEGPEGMLGVANVIANRVDSPLYPDNPVDVAAQPYQFSTNNTGAGGNQPQTRREVPVGSDLYRQAEEIVRGAIVERSLPDVTGRALMYHSRAITPYWANSATTRWGTVDLGGHRYYARQPVPPGSIPDVATLLSVRRAGPTPLTRTTTVRAKQAQAQASARVSLAVEAVDNQRRKAAVAFFPWALANEGDRSAAALSMTSRIGSRPDYSDSVSAPILVSNKGARRDYELAGLLDRRISLTAPNPQPTAADVASSGMVARGNINLSNRPIVRNSDGSVSTVRSMSVNIDGAEVLIPTVSDRGRIMSDDEAIREYERTGKHLGKFTTPQAANRYAETLHRQQEAMVAARPTGPQSRGGARAEESRGTSLITHVRKTYRVDEYGHPIIDEPVVTRPTAKPSPTWRVQDAITKAKAGVRASAMAPVAQSKVAWDAAAKAPKVVTAAVTGTSSSGAMRSAAQVLKTSQIRVSGTATGGSAPMRSAAATVSARDMKLQPAGSYVFKSGTARLPSGDLPAIEPIKKPSPAPIPVAPKVAPVPLPRIRRFGDPIIPPSVKGDPIDIRKLTAGIEAERRRLSGEPAPRSPVAPVVPSRRPDTPVQAAPGKVKLSGLPDTTPKGPQGRGSARPGPVSTATVKAPSKVIAPAVPARRPDTKPVESRRPIVIEVRGGRRTASPRLVPPQLPNAGGVQAVSPATGQLVQSNAWQESAFQWTENTSLPSAISGSSRWQTGY